jgi:hypothetical protein
VVRAKKEVESSSPPLLVLDIFSPYHVQSWGASSDAMNNISNDYQLGEGGYSQAAISYLRLVS